MMAQTVIVITNATVKFAATEATLDAAPDYQCQVVSASINANPNLQTVPATFCSGETQVPGATGYELALNWLQDWTAPGGGLSYFAYQNDAKEMFFSLTLDEADEPIAKGTLRVVSGAFGGDAGTPLQATATWPILGKPTITVPAAPVGP
jgi:hypothetical protein